jgi:hypothetical protein
LLSMDLEAVGHQQTYWLEGNTPKGAA